MLTNQQVADDFASGLRHGASGNMFIETAGNMTVIYSYGHHFPIAIKDGAYHALFTSDGYSQTTACHKGKVLRALQAEGVKVEYRTGQELHAMI